MSNQPVILNIQYTPYSMPKNATRAERERHADERAFYDMSGEKNMFEYMTTEGKRTGKHTALVAEDRHARKVHRTYQEDVPVVFERRKTAPRQYRPDVRIALG